MTETHSRPLRVLIIARQSIVRVGLRRLIAERDDIAASGEVASAKDAGDLGTGPPPDVILAGWDPASLDGDAALDALSKSGAPVLLIGDMPSPRELRAILRGGIRGFLLADATPEDISTALHSAYHGLLVLDPIRAHTLASGSQSSALAEEPIDEALTEREREVLQLMALGLPNKAIAHRLNISEHTVKFHVGSVLAKLAAISRTEAVTRAVRQGILAL
ncbi:MAG: response regulator transcription factor [Dehalococcoidia bacterium]|nr:response regulator transcription factor [Dehalococcoidia bacterium]